MDLLHQALAIVLGTLVGFALGLTGGGGSILTVPLLVYVVGESVTAAIGTSLAIVALSAGAGFVGHWRQQHVHLGTGLSFGLVGTVGAFVGAWLDHLFSAKQILLLLAILMLAAALAMMRRRTWSERAAASLSTGWTAWMKIGVTGLAVGILTGFFGVGGGFLVVPALILVLGLPMRLAVGTSLLIIAINSTAGLLAHLQYAGIDVTMTALFAAGGILGTAIGVAVAGRVPETRLRQVFAYGLATVALYLAVRNHPTLPAHAVLSHIGN